MTPADEHDDDRKDAPAPEAAQKPDLEPAPKPAPAPKSGSAEEARLSEAAGAMPEGARCGFVALIGEPNAGKSTLLNRMVGAKVSIVTHKVQTTRSRIRGVAIEGASQIVFIDTPGLFRPRRRLDRAMVAAAWTGADDADVVCLLVEAHRGLTDGVEEILKALDDRGGDRPVALIINKVDRVRAPELLGLTEKLNARRDFVATFMISAEKGYGCADLIKWLATRMPEGPWHYPEDQIADAPTRVIAAEITREKLTLRLHQELPYQLTVETEEWEERKNGSVRIQQVVYVAREGHRGIVLGNKGETMKSVGTAARAELKNFLGREVHLFIEVRVRENWLEERERYDNMGLDFDGRKGR
ncbi:GTP-binding protein Era [Albimonas donghaensis]|uniref:GTPase Era n=2 Tax=Albimonas donghaensis TaxID=356660 RepID=A0A1H2RTS0_9RHOB|nr:GTP-binding protein Era [Albimonas donghaensis]